MMVIFLFIHPKKVPSAAKMLFEIELCLAILKCKKDAFNVFREPRRCGQEKISRALAWTLLVSAPELLPPFSSAKPSMSGSLIMI